jgi:hypothetical protein
LILSSHLRLGLPSGRRRSGLSTKILYAPLFSPVRATSPAHLILLDLITRILSGDEYRSLSSSLCSLLHSPVASSLLGPNILLSTLRAWWWLCKIETGRSLIKTKKSVGCDWLPLRGSIECTLQKLSVEQGVFIWNTFCKFCVMEKKWPKFLEK